MISSHANDEISTGKAAAVVTTMCAAAVVIGIMVKGGGANERRPGVAGIQVVRVPPPKTEHRDAAVPISRLIANDVRAPSASDGRNWDDGGAHLDAMAAEVHAQTRDPTWASQRETQLRVRLARAVPRDASPPRVRCAATMCEVVGSLTSAIAPDEVGRTLQSLQGSDMRDALIDASLVGGPTIVNAGDGRGYVLYYRRRAD